MTPALCHGQLSTVPISKKSKVISFLLVVALGAFSYLYGTTDVAITSIKFDLRKIGESIYQAHSKTGKWPSQIADLEGTEYLNMPYRRDMLARRMFVIVWQPDLQTDPNQNRNRILAYDNGSLFSRLGWVWVCRGDLSIGRMSSEDRRQLNRQPQ